MRGWCAGVWDAGMWGICGAELESLMNDGAKESLGDALDMEGDRGNAFAKSVDYSQMGARLAALRQRAAQQ